MNRHAGEHPLPQTLRAARGRSAPCRTRAAAAALAARRRSSGRGRGTPGSAGRRRARSRRRARRRRRCRPRRRSWGPSGAALREAPPCSRTRRRRRSAGRLAGDRASRSAGARPTPRASSRGTCGRSRRSPRGTPRAPASGPRPSRRPGSRPSRGRRRRRPPPPPSPGCGRRRRSRCRRCGRRLAPCSRRELGRPVGRAVVDDDDLVDGMRFAAERASSTLPSVRSALYAGMTTVTVSTPASVAAGFSGSTDEGWLSTTPRGRKTTGSVRRISLRSFRSDHVVT